MSDTQAKETEIEIESGEPVEQDKGFELDSEAIELEAEETEAKTDEKPTDGPIEIEVEDGVKPTPRRLSRTTKRIIKANDEAAQAKAEAEALREENKLLRLSQQQRTQMLEEPDEDTFEGSEAEFKAAQRAYNQQEIKRIAAEEAQALVQQTLSKSNQESVASQMDSVIDAHYERAEAMNVTNYHQLEGNAADILGEDFSKAIIQSTDNAHRILASIGANPREAMRIAELAKSNPTKAFADALTFKIHPSLSPASPNALDPESQVDPGSGLTKDTGDMKFAVGAKFE